MGYSFSAFVIDFKLTKKNSTNMQIELQKKCFFVKNIKKLKDDCMID